MSVTIVGNLPAGVRIGRMVWASWSNVNLGTLREVWQAKGLPMDLFPGDASAATALRKALHEVSSLRRLVRPLGTRDGYGIVSETATDRTLHHEHTLTAWIEPADPTKGTAETLAIEPPDHPLAAQIREGYAAIESNYPREKLSVWYSQSIMPHVHAVALRPMGGIWYVPADGIDMIEHVDQAIRAAGGGKIYHADATDSPESLIEAVIDGFAVEADREATLLDAATADDAGLGARALRSKIAKADAFKEKIAAYKDLLGTAAETLDARFTDLAAALTVAMVAAEAAADAEKEKAKQNAAA